MPLLALLLPLALGVTQTTSNPMAEALSAQARDYGLTRPSPGIHLSPRAAAAYAMTSGCVPAVITGRPATEFFTRAPSARGREEVGRYTVSVPVFLQEEPNGTCTVGSASGDPEDLREAVLKALDDVGATRTTVSDTGAGSQDSNGSFRQELQCLTLDGQALFLVMSTSSARNRRPLMASLGRDPDASCLRRSGS